MKKIIPILVVSGALVGVSAISTACNQTTVEMPVEPFEPSPEHEEQLIKDPLYSAVKQLVDTETKDFTKEQLIGYRGRLLDAYLENILRIQLNSNDNYNSLVQAMLNARISQINLILSQKG